MRVWTEFNWLRISSVFFCFCEHGIEFSGYIGLHSSEFLDQMNNNQLFNSCFVVYNPGPRA